MSRARKFDHALLEREYIYDSTTPPISITGLADKHGMARAHLADIARKGKWFEKRKEVRLTVGEKVLDAMTDRWAETQTTIRERMLQLSLNLLDQAEKAVAAGEIKITKVADIQSIVATARVLLGDQAIDQASKDGPTIIDMSTVDMSPEKMAEMLPVLKALMAGKEADDSSASEPGYARTDAPPSPEGTLED